MPQNPNPIAIPKLMEPADAPNPILRVLLASAAQQKNNNIPAHAVNLLNCLGESPVIDVKRLKMLSFLGIPDEINGLRPVIWRILLNQWPADTTQWEEILRSQRDMYEEYKNELIKVPQ